MQQEGKALGHRAPVRAEAESARQLRAGELKEVSDHLLCCEKQFPVCVDLQETLDDCLSDSQSNCGVLPGCAGWDDGGQKSCTAPHKEGRPVLILY